VTQPLIVRVGQGVADSNLSLLFSGKLGICHCLPVEETERLCVFDDGWFYRNVLSKTFPPDSSKI
jgi:hypothetical protein